MIFSQKQLFSEAQAVTTSAPSTNVIDLGATGTVLNAPAALKRDIGKGRPIPIRIQLMADAGGTTPTLDVELQMSADEAFTTPITVAKAPQVAGGKAGDQVMINYVPKGTDERFMRLNYATGGTGPTHSITAGIVLADQSNS